MLKNIPGGIRMNLEQIKECLKSKDYDFLRENEHLGQNIIFLTLGGSHAYGTETPESDLDIRGCAVNGKMEILTSKDFQQVTEVKTDTTIYSFQKLVGLLASCNPNTIELLGNKPEHYLYLSAIGKELLEHASMFLSKRAIHSFGGYANQQLRRLENKSSRLVSQSEKEQHILKTIEHASYDFREKYFTMPEDAISLYVDKAIQEDYDTEIFMDISLSHYPLRDYAGMVSQMQGIVKAYGKVGKRNEKAIGHNKLAKHMMHLIRLYMMCLDILERERIITYREKEHDLLMDIRNGKFLNDQRQPIPEFYELVDEYEKRLEYAKEHSNLPEQPNEKEIQEFVASVNERIIKDKDNK